VPEIWTCTRVNATSKPVVTNHVLRTNILLCNITGNAGVVTHIQLPPHIARSKSVNAARMAWGEVGETWFTEEH